MHLGPIFEKDIVTHAKGAIVDNVHECIHCHKETVTLYECKHDGTPLIAVIVLSKNIQAVLDLLTKLSGAPEESVQDFNKDSQREGNPERN